MSRKLGFWSVFALVTGSQIGSAVFISPSTLAPFGVFGIFGWLISSLGAIALALVFAKLCSWFPHTGGPHALDGFKINRIVSKKLTKKCLRRRKKKWGNSLVNVLTLVSRFSKLFLVRV